MTNPSSSKRFFWFAIIVLLLGHVALRLYNNTMQDPYIDEGFHTTRAAIVWDFEQNPGRFAHGKLLLYFWLGIFEAEAPNFVFTARASITLWSMLTASTLFAIGRLLKGRNVGFLAMGLYAIMPLGVFFERMAMADPFAAGFVGLIAWRSLIYAKRPTYREGFIIGVLIGFATLAKLTTGLIPLLPPLTAALWYSWKVNTDIQGQIFQFLRIYTPPMILAAVVVMLMWAPITIPAQLAADNDPFLIVNSFNIEKDEHSAPLNYIETILPEIADFTTNALLAGVALGAVILFIIGHGTQRPILYLAVWLFLLGVLPITQARLISSRYFMTLAPPLALTLAYFFMAAWHNLPAWWVVVRPFYTVGITVWIIIFALPMVYTLITDFDELNLKNTNQIEYQQGVLVSENGIREAADYINDLDQEYDSIISDWNTCHLLFLYVKSDNPVQCLPLDTPMGSLSRYFREDANPQDEVLLIISGYGENNFFQRIGIFEWEDVLVLRRETPANRPINLWHIYLSDEYLTENGLN